MVGTTQPMTEDELSDSITAIEELAADNSDDERTVLAENQLYDFITNAPVKDTLTERLLQAVAQALVDEYGLEHMQLVHGQPLVYETVEADFAPSWRTSFSQSFIHCYARNDWNVMSAAWGSCAPMLVSIRYVARTD
ncbi:MAG: hypothetical protein KGS73_06895 [Chloroflexi bacterium]|nr:hypothetical protein [Chloroflexota bacterium]